MLCTIFILLVFMGCSLLNQYLTMSSLYRQQTFRIQIIIFITNNNIHIGKIAIFVRIIIILFEMRVKSLLIISIVLFVTNTERCTDTAGCFIKKIFDFSYPSQGLYNISINSDVSNHEYMIRAYGDFNNDLRADLIAYDNYSNTNIFIFDKETGDYISTYTYPIYQSCSPINYYLADINFDHKLDITVWGVSGIDNCMYSIINNGNGFRNGTSVTNIFTPSTVQPSLFQFRIGSNLTNCFLIYNMGTNTREIMYYDPTTKLYKSVSWETIFSDNSYATIPFSNYHWNTFIDLTNDCFADFILTNNQENLQFWIYSSQSNTFIFNSSMQVTGLQSLNVMDMNYDGALDLILTTTNKIDVYKGTRLLSIDSEFCIPGSMSFRFEMNAYSYTLNDPFVFSQQNLQIADLNIDGYPQIMFLYESDTTNNIRILQNMEGKSFQEYNSDDYKKVEDYALLDGSTLVSISFFDLLDNGIVDFIVNTQIDGVFRYKVIYNNNLFQNSFFIKGYATDGVTSQFGSQVSGVSFYWANSLGNQQKVSLYPQVTQTAYNAFPMPYVLAGLGRANNYVQLFTIGRQGTAASWTPIIPNSQLAIFSGGSSKQSWLIKIFVMPSDKLVQVVIVSVIILFFLGLVLFIIKCKQTRDKKQQQPLLAEL